MRGGGRNGRGESGADGELHILGFVQFAERHNPQRLPNKKRFTCQQGLFLRLWAWRRLEVVGWPLAEPFGGLETSAGGRFAAAGEGGEKSPLYCIYTLHGIRARYMFLTSRVV